MTDGQKTVLRLGLIVFIIAAFAYSAFSLWTNAGPPRGSEKDEILLTCPSCNQDSLLSSAEYAKLPRDPATRACECPKCGAKGAIIASLQCPKCQRGIPPQPANAPLVCPFCKAPMREPDDEGAAPAPPGQ